MFELLGLPHLNLVTNNKELTQPYISTFLPLFYLGQDDGYNKIYSAKNNFIKDQYVEMVRYALGVPPKNSPYQQKTLKIEKQKLSSLDELINNTTSIYKEIKTESTEITTKSRKELEHELKFLTTEFERIKTSKDNVSQADFVYRNVKRNIQNDIFDIDQQILEIVKRHSAFEKFQILMLRLKHYHYMRSPKEYFYLLTKFVELEIADYSRRALNIMQRTYSILKIKYRI